MPSAQACPEPWNSNLVQRHLNERISDILYCRVNKIVGQVYFQYLLQFLLLGACTQRNRVAPRQG